MADHKTRRDGVTRSAEHPRFLFGEFGLDYEAGELRKNGKKLKLYGQPLDILAVLLERNGQVVTREELQERLWPSDTFVDFEHGLNSAVRKLRETLGDNAEAPQYVETLPRRGYRFIGLVTDSNETAAFDIKGLSQADIPKKNWLARRIVPALALGIVLLSLTFYFSISTRVVPKVLAYRQLTSDRQLKNVNPCGFDTPLLSDGPRLFFSEPNSTLNQVSVAGGDVAKIATPFDCFSFSAISPDGTELVGGYQPDGNSALDKPLWTFSIASGQARRLGDLAGHDAIWSPDGKQIAYTSGGEPATGGSALYVALAEGSGVRKIVALEQLYIAGIRWRPDGRALRILGTTGSVCSLWEVSVDGSNLHRFTPFTGESRCTSIPVPTRDARYSIFLADGEQDPPPQIWAIRENRFPYLASGAKPIRLTSGTHGFPDAIPSTDGKQVFALGSQRRGELVRYDLGARKVEPFLGGISAEHVTFSRDGKRLAYVSFPDSILWRSDADGNNRMQLTSRGLYPALPRWSPDGTRIVFAASTDDSHYRLYVVSADGGKPEIVSQSDRDQVDPSWAPDGRTIIFGESQWAQVPQIFSLDLETHQVSRIPGSEGLYSPSISPDGRFIVALDTPGNRKLMLFDRRTQKWSPLSQAPDGMLLGWPQWIADTRYLYVADTSPKSAHQARLYRIEINTRKFEEFASVPVAEGAIGQWGMWIGMTPEGSPLFQRDTSIHEVYAIDLDLP